MNDPLVDDLNKTWSPTIINEPDVEKVRLWLKERDTAQIKLYISAFEEPLSEKHPVRLRLLNEELERREEPPPDRVAQIIAALRSNWLIGGAIVFALSVGGIATLLGQIGPLLPLGRPSNTNSVDAAKIQALEDAVNNLERATSVRNKGGN